MIVKVNLCIKEPHIHQPLYVINLNVKRTKNFTIKMNVNAKNYNLYIFKNI